MSVHAHCLVEFTADANRATVVVLYRPYVLKGPASLPDNTRAQWEKTALERARTAASNTNSLLQKLININSIQYLRPMVWVLFDSPAVKQTNGSGYPPSFLQCKFTFSTAGRQTLCREDWDTIASNSV